MGRTEPAEPAELTAAQLIAELRVLAVRISAFAEILERTFVVQENPDA